jgi:magnesium transporter
MGKPHVEKRSAEEITNLIRAGCWNDVVLIFERLHPADAAAALDQLPSRQQRTVFKQLSIDTAAQLLPYMQYFDQFVALHSRQRDEIRQIVSQMNPDDRMRLLDELPENAWQQLVGELADPERELTERLAAYPPNSAGRYLTPSFVLLSPGMRVADAVDEIRRTGHGKETIDVAYIVASDGSLVSEVRLSSLVMAAPAQLVTAVAEAPLVAVKDVDSLEDALAVFERYDRVALPVVNQDGKMLGILTFDDVMDVARSLATRDIQRMGGMEALDAPYFSVRLREMLQKRAGWLAILFLGEMLTATAMGHFEDEIATAVVLALFVPLIISSGGNSGSQATSLLIRSLALREISLRDWWRVGAREVFLGLSLGAFLGVIGFARIVSWEWLHLTEYGPHYLLIAATVWLSLIGVVGFGTLVGSMLPFILRRCGFDPATSSSPLVATLADVTGLIIYFSTARIILGGVLL